jgi:hypothetical protein
MLFEFKSRATGSVIMTESVGKTMLEVIGKAPAAQGIITAAQLPQAIHALKSAVGAERDEIARFLAQGRSGRTDDRDESPGTADADSVPAIRFEQRAVPLIEMLERSLAAGRDVTWGI